MERLHPKEAQKAARQKRGSEREEKGGRELILVCVVPI